MKRIIIPFATILFLLTGCSNTFQDMEDEAMCFDIHYPASTKVTATAFETGDALSLFAVEWNGDTQIPLQVGGNLVNNAQLTCNGGKWSSALPLYWGSGPCDF